MRCLGREKMIPNENCYRTPSLAAHQERTSSGAALLRRHGLCACYVDINLRLVIVLGQGRKKKKKGAMERRRPPAVLGPEERRQVLPVLVSCQKEVGPPIPG